MTSRRKDIAQRRVVVTGLGAVTPLGLNLSDTWAGLTEGRSGVGPITRFDASKLTTRIAAEVKGFSVDGYLNSKEARKMGLFVHYAIAASFEAMAQAKLPRDLKEAPGLDLTRVGVSISSGMGGLPEISHWDRELNSKDKKVVTPFFVPMIIPNMASGYLSIMTGAKGPNLCMVTACASSAHALGEGARMIRDGTADIMIAGGAEAVICELGIVGFASMKALSTRNDDPAGASRPYSADRDGFVMGEGSAMLVIEELEHALKRGAPILAELAGYGVGADAYHMTHPSEDGSGAEACMRASIADSGLTAGDIDYVNTHGTSTPAGDAIEAQAVARIFADHKKNLHVSSTKSMTGHMLGAAGAMEALVCVQAIHTGTVPPTINLTHPDEASAATGLNLTPLKAVKKTVRAALTNSFGFGGTNGSLVFKRYHS
jgi:3-oxoacyl-[acyl-carrier-protein] synthase II